MIHHYILTRFNLRGPQKDKNKNQTYNNPEWLKHRINLFKTYCFPSIRSQYNQNFTWLIGFDSETDPNVYQEFQSYSNFVPILVPNKESNFNEYCLKYINQIFNNQKPIIIITTRLDSDDGLSRDAIGRIHKLALDNQTQKHSFLALNFHRGLYLNEKTGEMKPEFIHFESAYCSLIEYHPTTLSVVTKTAMSFRQGTLSTENPAIDISSGQPFWLRVIHKRNVLNDRFFRTDPHNHIIEKDFLYINLAYRRQIKTQSIITKNPSKTSITKSVPIFKPSKEKGNSIRNKILSKRNLGIRRRI